MPDTITYIRGFEYASNYSSISELKAWREHGQPLPKATTSPVVQKDVRITFELGRFDDEKTAWAKDLANWLYSADVRAVIKSCYRNNVHAFAPAPQRIRVTLESHYVEHADGKTRPAPPMIVEGVASGETLAEHLMSSCLTADGRLPLVLSFEGFAAVRAPLNIVVSVK